MNDLKQLSGKVAGGNGRDMRGQKKEVVIPFDSQGFIEAWSIWKQYRKEEHRFVYKSSFSEQAALNKLVKLAQGSELIAVEIIEQSMSEGWKGLFKLRENGTNQTGNVKNSGATPEQIAESFVRTFGADAGRN